MYSNVNFEPVCCSMFSSKCCFLMCIQGNIRWSGIPNSKNFLQFAVIHTVRGFWVANEAEVDVFLKFPCFLPDLKNVGNLISDSSVFSEISLYIWKFSVHILLKPNLKDFEYYLASMWNEHNCTVVWTFFGIAFLWDWNENWHFPILKYIIERNVHSTHSLMEIFFFSQSFVNSHQNL